MQNKPVPASKAVWSGPSKAWMLWHLPGMPLMLPTTKGTMLHPDRLLLCWRINCQGKTSKQKRIGKTSYSFTSYQRKCLPSEHLKVWQSTFGSCLLSSPPTRFNPGILTIPGTGPESSQASASLSPWCLESPQGYFIACPDEQTVTMMLEQYLRNVEKEENCSLKQFLTEEYFLNPFFFLSFLLSWVSSPISGRPGPGLQHCAQGLCLLPPAPANPPPSYPILSAAKQASTKQSSKSRVTLMLGISLPKHMCAPSKGKKEKKETSLMI